MTLSHKVLLVLVVVAIAIFWGVQVRAANAPLDENRNPAVLGASCTTTTHGPVAIGASNSSTILAASSKRAWAVIQRAETSAGVATSTSYLNFDEGTAATTVNGIRLSTTTPERVFGLKTDAPYTGAVTGITSVGSTTVHVTECVYD